MFRHQGKITACFIYCLSLCGLFSLRIESAAAADILGCEAVVNDRLTLNNRAVVDYSDRSEGSLYSLETNPVPVKLQVVDADAQQLQLEALGVTDAAGREIASLGTIAQDLAQLLQQEDLQPESANTASLSMISQLATLSTSATSTEVITAVKQSAVSAVDEPTSKKIIEAIPDSRILTTLAGLETPQLQALGLNSLEISALSSSNQITSDTEASFNDAVIAATEKIAQSLEREEIKARVLDFPAQLQTELANIRTGEQSVIQPGSKLNFKFRLENQQSQAVTVQLPDAQAIAQNGLIGAQKVSQVTYIIDEIDETEAQDITANSSKISIPATSALELNVEVEVEEAATTEISTLAVELQTDCGTPATVQTANLLPAISTDSNLIDPLGQITGCAGELLNDYEGFSIALYNSDPTDIMGSTIQDLTPLTPTELPNLPNNDIPAGVKPNTENSNPFFLTNSDEGKYSFLFDEALNQLDTGKTYILIVNPPENSTYSDRRIRLVIGDRQENIVEYTATSLDGKPITATDGQTTVTGEIVLVNDAERVGLDLAVLDLTTNICDAQEVQITKTGDRATAEPGDTVLYRLAVRNLASTDLENISITDILPAGFKFIADSVKASLGETAVDINTTQNGNTLTFSSNIVLASEQVLNLVYAAQLTPNALRGDGLNRANVNAERTDNSTSVQDGPAIHELRIEPGILEDTGIVIGRVFVDHNFDGQQQSGEPGIPNAVIFLEDGNRLITDSEGLFSLANVLPGVHTGRLDLTSIPGYRLAPNLYFSEGNSKSRLIKLEPGGMVRMNFGVTPTAASEQEPNLNDSPPANQSDNQSETPQG